MLTHGHESYCKNHSLIFFLQMNFSEILHLNRTFPFEARDSLS